MTKHNEMSVAKELDKLWMTHSFLGPSQSIEVKIVWYVYSWRINNYHFNWGEEKWHKSAATFNKATKLTVGIGIRTQIAVLLVYCRPLSPSPEPGNKRTYVVEVLEHRREHAARGTPVSREVEQDDALAGQRLVGGDVATVGSDKGLSVQELNFIEKSERLKIGKKTSMRRKSKTAINLNLLLKIFGSNRREEFLYSA